MGCQESSTRFFISQNMPGWRAHLLRRDSFTMICRKTPPPRQKKEPHTHTHTHTPHHTTPHHRHTDTHTPEHKKLCPNKVYTRDSQRTLPRPPPPKKKLAESRKAVQPDFDSDQSLAQALLLTILQILQHGKPKVPPFLRAPSFFKALPQAISASKLQIDTLQYANWGGRCLCNSIQNLHGGGCQFAFWRVRIHSLSWGCCIQSGDPQQGGYLGSCDLERTSLGSAPTLVCIIKRSCKRYTFWRVPTYSLSWRCCAQKGGPEPPFWP